MTMLKATTRNACRQCASTVRWSGYCEACYLETFGDPPADQCMHGNDPNHVPCYKCFELDRTKPQRDADAASNEALATKVQSALIAVQTGRLLNDRYYARTIEELEEVRDALRVRANGGEQ